MVVIVMIKNYFLGLICVFCLEGGVLSERVIFFLVFEIEFNVVFFVEDWVEEDEGRLIVE